MTRFEFPRIEFINYLSVIIVKVNAKTYSIRLIFILFDCDFETLSLLFPFPVFSGLTANNDGVTKNIATNNNSPLRVELVRVLNVRSPSNFDRG